MHLDDLIQYEDEESEEAIKEKLGPIFSLLNRRCVQSSHPTIVGVSCIRSENIIRSAKQTSPMKKTQFWILNQLEMLAKKHASFYNIDLDSCFAKIGTNNAFDSRNWYFAHCRNSSQGLYEIANAIHKVLLYHTTSPSKVLVLDCDNTLWGGVIGEDGLEGIALGTDGIGKAFVDFQKEVKKLVKEGVVLVLASQNNEGDVWEVFDNHQSMELSRKDIIAHKINWNDKSSNMLELANELDLALDSFVFWDDNPVERGKARALVPFVTTVEVPENVLEWPNLLRNLDAFSKTFVTDEDQNKAKQYRIRAKFVSDLGNVTDEITYLKSIKLNASSTNLSESNIGRAVQLCQKTNQFNLRTVRYTAYDLKELTKVNEDFCILTSLEDIYGGHGIVGMFCLKEIDTKTVFLDNFLLSCRVLGRHYESWMLSEVMKIAHNNNYQRVMAEFIPTERNNIASSFLENNGFTKVESYSEIGIGSLSIISEFIGTHYLRTTENLKVRYRDLYENN